MTKPHAATSLAQQTFLARSPVTWEIAEDVLDGTERHVVVIQSRDAKGAKAQNACECAIARSTRRSFCHVARVRPEALDADSDSAQRGRGVLRGSARTRLRSD